MAPSQRNASASGAGGGLLGHFLEDGIGLHGMGSRSGRVPVGSALTDQKVFSYRIEWGHRLGGLTVPGLTHLPDGLPRGRSGYRTSPHREEKR